jgi:hypothetical protein
MPIGFEQKLLVENYDVTPILVHSFMHSPKCTSIMLQCFLKGLYLILITIFGSKPFKESQNQVIFFCIPLLVWNVLYYTCGHLVNNMDSFHTF